MLICYAINRNLSKREYLVILLGLLSVTSGCSKPEEQAAGSAAQAQSLLEQNRIAEARLTIKKAILAKDDVSEYHLIRGRIEYAADAFENAFAAYSEALALDSTNQEALQAISQIGLRVGRYNESIDATNKLLVLNPIQKDALLTRGLHALVKRNYVEALSNAEKILSTSPLDEGGVVLKARASFLSGSPNDATRILDEYEASRPNTVAVSLTRLEIYRELRNAKQMNKQFSDLEKLLPDDLSLRVDQANFHFKNGERDKATKMLASVMANKKASRENVSNSVELWREYAVNQLDIDLSNLIARSGQPTSRIAAARYFASTGDYATANILIGNITGPDADAERANIALIDGKKRWAQTLSEAILSRDATHCAALGTQAKLRLASGQAAVALHSAQSAASECAGQPELWELTARAYASLGDAGGTRRVFRQGIKANKQSQPLTRAYVQWLLMEGQQREAVAAARALTRYAPALMSGWRLYAETCTKTNSSCTTEAKQGLADSATRYGLDLLPGELPPNGLFGRFVIR